MPVEHSVQLGTQNYHDSIYRQLLELQKQEELPVHIEEIQQGKHWLIECKFELPCGDVSEEQGMITKIHRYYLANALAETILGPWERDYVSRLLHGKYRLKKAECQTVLPKALQYLNDQKGLPDYRVQRKTRLVTQILSSLESNSLFDIEGFLGFRAQEYKADLDKAVSGAVDEYVLEREYLEFIQLLKHFLDTQPPHIDTLHVGICSQGKFHLYNDQGEKVTGIYLDGMTVEEGVQDFSYEDLLVSALIAASPRKVVLHIRYPGYRDTLQTIRHVFEEKVKDCPGCSLCNKLMTD
ncbi:MAG: sporulation protein YtxC [Desulfitobacteriaceae bacterium]